MRIYNLKLSLELVEVGEQPDADVIEKHPLLQDPIDNLTTKMGKMFDKITVSPFGTTAPGSLILTESRQFPSSGFQDALDVLKQFHELASQIGMPIITEGGPNA